MTAHFKGVVVLNHQLISLVRQYGHLIVHTLEDTTLYLAMQLPWTILFYFSVFTFHLSDIHILWTNDHIHLGIFAKTFVHALKIVLAEVHHFILDHGGI